MIDVNTIYNVMEKTEKWVRYKSLESIRYFRVGIYKNGGLG